MFVLKNKNGKKYFVNPSFQSWDFTDNKDEATKFDTVEEANNMRDTVNRASDMTYWDYDDIPPEAIVVPLESL